MATEKPEPGPLIPLPVVILVLLVVVVAAGGWLYMRYGARAPAAPVLTPEAKAYVRHLKLSEVEIKASTTYLSQQVVEITGKITNNGDRPLKQVDLNCVFSDTLYQVCLRERVAIVRAKGGELQPGETRAFRLPFDNIPSVWNQTLPQLVIAQIVF